MRQVRDEEGERARSGREKIECGRRKGVREKERGGEYIGTYGRE